MTERTADALLIAGFTAYMLGALYVFVIRSGAWREAL